ncbi:YciI family protein [uncultured Ruegeria sp.]|uniref:YciI family protein n=1 Tax=uncultured Ruegeria sp. TaxID=259304 RepID=UPI00260F0BBF|nr:YciI family protein [uncultured Ruegeria sp.]
MKFIILFEDAPDADPDIRKTHMAKHLDFLETNADKIEAAGPLSDAADQGRDGLWIVEGDTEDEVDQLVYEDPFWSTGLRKSYSIIKWKQVYADGARLIHPS